MTFNAGRFVLECCVFEDGMDEPEWGYVTSWDYISDAMAAFDNNGKIPVGFRLTDDITNEVWKSGERLLNEQ